jgi:hypothetical protein
MSLDLEEQPSEESEARGSMPSPTDEMALSPETTTDNETTPDDDGVLPALVEGKNSCEYNFGREKMIERMINQVKEERRNVQRSYLDIESLQARGQSRRLDETRTQWITLGMIREEDAHLLTSVVGPHHPNIESSRAEYFARKKEEETKALLEKASQYYKDDWVLGKEKEMWDLQRQKEAAVECDVERAITYGIGVAVDALRLRFQNDAIPGLDQYLLEERKRKVVEMGLISSRQALSVQSIWEPLPPPLPLDHDEEAEEDIFCTPPLLTPSSVPALPPSSAQALTPSPLQALPPSPVQALPPSPGTKRGTPSTFMIDRPKRRKEKPKPAGNWILDYFWRKK